MNTHTNHTIMCNLEAAELIIDDKMCGGIKVLGKEVVSFIPVPLGVGVVFLLRRFTEVILGNNLKLKIIHS